MRPTPILGDRLTDGIVPLGRLIFTRPGLRPALSGGLTLYWHQ